MLSTPSFVIRDTQDTFTFGPVIHNQNFEPDPPFSYETLNSDDEKNVIHVDSNYDTVSNYSDKTPTSYQQNVSDTKTKKLHKKVVIKIIPKPLLKFNKF